MHPVGPTVKFPVQSRSRNWSQCRDSSLYGHVQTISHNPILAPTAVQPSLQFLYFHIFAYLMLLHISHVFALFTYLAHFVIPHISHISHFHISHIFTYLTFSHISHFHISHIFTYLTFSHISHFHTNCIFHALHVFCTLMYATMHLPRIHRTLFACPVLVLQGPLVHISLCFTHIISYISLHIHLYSLISLFVYITSPLYV
jgi:hypothetical protein